MTDMGDYVGLVEMVLVFGVVLAWAIRELIVTKRALREDREKADKDL